jgi:hypothetical protein
LNATSKVSRCAALRQRPMPDMHRPLITGSTDALIMLARPAPRRLPSRNILPAVLQGLRSTNANRLPRGSDPTNPLDREIRSWFSMSAIYASRHVRDGALLVASQHLVGMTKRGKRVTATHDSRVGGSHERKRRTAGFRRKCVARRNKGWKKRARPPRSGLPVRLRRRPYWRSNSSSVKLNLTASRGLRHLAMLGSIFCSWAARGLCGDFQATCVLSLASSVLPEMVNRSTDRVLVPED